MNSVVLNADFVSSVHLDSRARRFPHGGPIVQAACWTCEDKKGLRFWWPGNVVNLRREVDHNVGTNRRWAPATNNQPWRRASQCLMPTAMGTHGA